MLLDLFLIGPVITVHPLPIAAFAPVVSAPRKVRSGLASEHPVACEVRA
ncbi:hypothetical protein ACWCQL_23940 [Streptomyces sp. NPDC002073]|nr:hypothetical protein [Streptomyces sp. NBC_00239]